MSEKVKVPRRVADALEKVISEEEQGNEWAFFNIVRCGKDQLDEHAAIIKEYFNGVRMLDLARVFINGYEVEMSRADKAVEWFVTRYHHVSSRTIVQNIAKILNGEEADF